MSGLSGNILITGGSGTLGHAIVRAAERDGWDAQITVYSRSELRQAQMRAKHPRCRYVLGDVRDAERTAAAIAGHDIVIHAAAVKRLPDAELQPQNCYETNVAGSANVARACLLHGVKVAIAVSTDKACRAISVYGHSKGLMEGLWRAQPDGVTRFVGVRYGNVVASNGSVIPIWRDQAARGETLTVTNPTMTRFWMAPSDAVRLLVDAAYLPPNTILVPKMCALSIGEMAAMVAPDATQQVVGLRSIEKAHEDLVHVDEVASETLTHFRLGFGETGHRYTSASAPRLTRDAFLAMLTEAESYE
jgi:UDP-N-acetylglucosamine 4,6-dehydratase